MTKPINMNDEKAPAAVRNERAALIDLASRRGAQLGATGPGRYDRASDRMLAAALDHLDADEEAGGIETTGLHLARFGRFIRTTDEQGFVDVIVFASIDEAAARLTEVAEVEAKMAEVDPEPPTTAVYGGSVMGASANLVAQADAMAKLAEVLALDAVIEYEQALDASLRAR